MLATFPSPTQRRVFVAACAHLAGSVTGALLAGEPGAASLLAGAVGVALAEGWHKAEGRRVLTSVLPRWKPPQERRDGDATEKRTEKTMQETQTTRQRMHHTPLQVQRRQFGAMEADAQTIMGFFKKRNVRCPIVGGYVTPTFYVYRLNMDIDEDYGRLLKSLSDMERVLHESRLDAGRIEEDAVTVIRAQRKPLMLEVNRADPRPLLMNEIDRRPVSFEALLGMMYATKTGTPISWKFTQPDQAHLLIAGMTGSGKSNLLVSLLLDTCAATSPGSLALYLVDGGNADLRPLADLPHVAMYVNSVDEVQDVITTVEAELVHRKEQGVTEPRIMLVVEELSNLALSADSKTLKARIVSMSKIAQEGRKWGIHVVACAQKPNAEIVGTFVKSNINTRLCGMVATNVDGNTALGLTGTGAERLPGGGAFIYRSGQSVQRIQAPWIETPAKIVRDIRRIWRTTTTLLPRTTIATKQVVAPPSQVELDAEVIRNAWMDGRPQSQLIRILFGRVDVNTGGANRRRMLAAVEWLERNATTTTGNDEDFLNQISGKIKPPRE